ncbi:MAG: T9SS type A sorting domain-containing protein, partial [Candidatus Cloacimonetes bacterium]|nr:T9SS type A sorting domain-containing protein [Candidatus Cloacimonadota bacterium]
ALSAPHSHNSTDPIYIGYAYIFAGNAQLTDTTVANEDELNPPITQCIKMNFYPNPLDAHNQEIKYEIEGSIPEHVTSATLTIHNIKGQVVHRCNLDEGLIQRKMGAISTKPLAAGVYIISLDINGRQVSTQKISIIAGRNK